MANNKLGIIGGSGLYDIEGLKTPTWKKVKTPWGEPSDKILNFKYNGKEVCFLPRHGRGHKISPTNINNIDGKIDLPDMHQYPLNASSQYKPEELRGRGLILQKMK